MFACLLSMASNLFYNLILDFRCLKILNMILFKIRKKIILNCFLLFCFLNHAIITLNQALKQYLIKCQAQYNHNKCFYKFENSKIYIKKITKKI